MSENLVFTELREAVRWDPQRLAVPRLPYIVANLADKRGDGCNLDSVAAPHSFREAIPPSLRRLVTPEPVSNESLSEWFQEDGLYVEDMPIKVPGGTICIPDGIYYSQFKLILDISMLFEMLHNPAFNDQYFYLTIQQSQVKQGTVQRKAGIHLDGFQKPTIIPQIAQHQLAITNMIPTEFIVDGIDCEGFSNDKRLLFGWLNIHGDYGDRYFPAPYELHLLNAFCPHEPGFATEDCFRTFIRFSASVIPFMGEDNTRNPLLDLEWNKKAKLAYYDSIAK